MAKAYPGIRGRNLKQLVDANNLKVVFLWYPMINNLYEVGQLFNLLRGYIFQSKFILKRNWRSPSYDTLRSLLNQ